MELEPSQIKFLPSPDDSFPEAIYEFSGTDKFKIEPRFLSSDILKSNKQTLLR